MPKDSSKQSREDTVKEVLNSVVAMEGVAHEFAEKLEGISKNMKTDIEKYFNSRIKYKNENKLSGKKRGL